jgi:hypothetical protein
MAKQQSPARKQSLSKRNERQTDRDTAGNGREEDAASYEKELAGYLRDRIKPGLNRGSIPLLARSIAKDIARHEIPNGASEDAEADAEADDEPRAESDDEVNEETDDEVSDDGEAGPDLETALREVQADLGEDWILYFAVQGEDTWLTAEKEDASQRVEAPNPSVLSKAIKVLNEGGGRSGSKRPDSEDER